MSTPFLTRLLRVCGLLALIWIALYLLPVLTTPRVQLARVVDTVYDDGYYYLAIAANIADTGRSTLDGVTDTNGYQPLWLWLLVGLAKLVGTEALRFMRASCALVAGIAALALLATFRREPDDERATSACIGVGLAVVIMIGQPVFMAGLETILMLPCALPLMVLIERRRSARDDLWLSAMLATAFLVRLDALALLASVVLVGRVFPVAGQRLDRHALMRLLAITTPTVLTYAVLNWLAFGIPVPVSGLAKAVGGARFSNWGIFLQNANGWRPLGFALLGVAVAELVSRGSGAGSRFRRSIAVFVLAAVIQYLYYASLSAWYLWSWYYYLHFLAIAACVARIVWLFGHLQAAGRRRLPVAAALMLVVSLAYLDARQVRRSYFPRPPLPSVIDEAASTPLPIESASVGHLKLVEEPFLRRADRPVMVAMGDTSGALAYWGRDRLRVVQMEGLTLDAAYIEARRHQQANDYFDRRFAIDVLIVDREYTPLVAGADGHRQYAVADPISGRVMVEPVPLFCFPESSRIYARETLNGGIRMVKMAFRYADREACSAESLALIRSAEAGQGLRQFSMPGVYAQGWASAASEDRDRRRWQHAAP